MLYSWTGNTQVNFNESKTYSVNFSIGALTHYSMQLIRGTMFNKTIRYNRGSYEYDAYKQTEELPIFESGWVQDSYRTIEVNGGTDALNSDFVAFLKANGTCTPDPEDLGKKFLDFDGLSHFKDKLDDLFDGKQPTINDLDDIREGASLGLSSLQKPSTFQVGQFFKVASIDSEGNPVLEATDVQGGLPILTGTTAPTTSTVGQVGQLYINTQDKRFIYICVNISSGSYSWDRIIVNATNKDESINIGSSQSGINDKSVTIGIGAIATGFGGTSIGTYTRASEQNATALGWYAQATATKAIQIGDGTNNEASTFKVAFAYNKNYKMLGEEGIIPKERFNLIKTTMDSVATVQTEYYLGEQSSLTITLPTGNAGEKISVVFYSGTTATSLSVSGTYLGELPTPNSNERIEMSFLYDNENWCLLSNVMGVE